MAHFLLRRVRATAMVIATAMTLLGWSSVANAITFNLDQNFACGALPSCGVVSVVQGADTHTLNVTITLATGVLFSDTGSHEAVSFNLSGSPAATIGNFTDGTNPITGWVQTAGGPNDGAGTFTYSADCNNGANASTCPTPVAGTPTKVGFTITVAGTITPSDLVKNSTGYYFAVDINATGAGGSTGVAASNLAVNPCTGPVGCTPSPVPLPAGLPLYGTGLAGVALVRWLVSRRRVTVGSVA